MSTAAISDIEDGESHGCFDFVQSYSVWEKKKKGRLLNNQLKENNKLINFSSSPSCAKDNCIKVLEMWKWLKVIDDLP